MQDKLQECKSIFSKDCINVVLSNARSIKCVNKKVNKLVQLQNITASTNCNIFGITETWRNGSVNSNELFNDIILYADVTVVAASVAEEYY